MNNQELQMLVENISLQTFHLPFRHQAYFNTRLRTTGGRYHLQDHDIDINPRVYRLYGRQELIGVIKHELCHYHLHLLGKGYQHRDQDFKSWLEASGATRYVKDLRSSREKQRLAPKYVYICQKCGKTYLRKRRINTARYVCGECGGKLREKKPMTGFERAQ